MTYFLVKKKMKCLYKNFFWTVLDDEQDASMVEPTVTNMFKYDIEIEKKSDGTVDLFTNTVHIFK